MREREIALLIAQANVCRSQKMPLQWKVQRKWIYRWSGRREHIEFECNECMQHKQKILNLNFYFRRRNKKSDSVANAMGTGTYRCQFTIDWLLVLHDALGNIPMRRKCPENIVDMRPSTQHNKCQCFPSYSLPRAWPFSLSLSDFFSLTHHWLMRKLNGMRSLDEYAITHITHVTPNFRRNVEQKTTSTHRCFDLQFQLNSHMNQKCCKNIFSDVNVAYSASMDESKIFNSSLPNARCFDSVAFNYACHALYLLHGLHRFRCIASTQIKVFAWVCRACREMIWNRVPEPENTAFSQLSEIHDSITVASISRHLNRDYYFPNEPWQL